MLTINNTLDGYLKDVEIKGNTVQDPDNLADIRSVGDKVEGQELYEIPVLSCGKNLFGNFIVGGYYGSDGNIINHSNSVYSNEYIRVEPGKKLLGNHNKSSMQICSYDINKNFLRRNNVELYRHTIADDVRFIKVSFYDLNDALNNQFQLEFTEGNMTKPTLYEPYQEDKLTILSLVQLEKVGDVRDRIVCKDGVWGVEKNVITKLFDGSENNVTGVSLDGNGLNYRLCYSRKKVLDNVADSSKLMSNKFECFVYSSSTNNVTVPSFRFIYTNSELYCVVPATEFPEHPSTQAFKEKVASYGTYIKYPTTQPQFIPLPHDQQVKLRTFANKTNISFLTEIEGMIKAQVPKSIGATVNTHTEQINNLNKELDRVKKLEESTVSTVTTESDFTTVEATNNGYFEDVKLEGKTLVNLATQPTNNGSINNQYATISTVTNIKPSTEYTYIIRNNGSETLKLYLNTNGGFDWFDLDVEANSTVIGKAKTLPTIDGDIWLSLSKTETVEQNLQVVLLEGDHTQNPPSYFEGLKSVGQSATTSEDGADEIVVSSVNENLFDETKISYPYIVKVGEKSNGKNLNVIKVKPNTTYTFKAKTTNGIVGRVLCILGDKKIKFDGNTNTQSTIFNYFRDNYANGRVFEYKQLNQNPITFTTYNDTNYVYINADCSANGVDEWIIESIQLNEGLQIKEYTPHQLDKKRLLFYNNETQTWEKPILREWDSIEKHSDGKYYYHVRSKEGDYVEGDESLNDCITDLTVSVKKLAEEKVYECTNIDLITYANETNYIVESGVLSPKTTLKVHSNISNVVSLLQKKVSLLESNMTKYMITQNRLQLSSTYSADSVTFKVDYTVCSENMSQENYDTDLYNLILNNILVGKDNYNYDHMFNIIMDYASWSQISWDQFDILVGLMDIQHNPPIEEIPTDDEIVEEMPNEIM